ncbi:MAG: HD domain-containing protein [Chloroflexota bacterium]|nr:HD domain-containing protein [Lentimicrobium sp.]
MDIEGLSQFICKKMEEQLPPFVIYHGVDHTYDVHSSVLRLAHLEQLDEYNTNLIRAAAWLHDTGIIVKFEDHEIISANFAEEYLPDYGFTPSEIVQVKHMILATQLPQIANNLNEKILCDADLDYLGRNDFFIIGQKLRLEWLLIGNNISLFDWYKLQMEFLKNHHYFTKSAQLLRNERKNQNMAEIQNLFNCARLNK